MTMRMSLRSSAKEGTYQGDIYLMSHVRRYRLISNDALKKLLHPLQIINSAHSRRTPNTPFAAPTRPVNIPERIRSTQSRAHCNVTSPWESASVASDQFSPHATPRSGDSTTRSNARQARQNHPYRLRQYARDCRYVARTRGEDRLDPCLLGLDRGVRKG
ncbi:hypothetical protein BKA56DRAFT_615207 [Ilyonectria sp. MPI-CAGE-AT-0026]|nr:hypothetical protein BKA56DRAFT_615207 [Ilyonectria sp. MPI-CAGE-AT-0026]